MNDEWFMNDANLLNALKILYQKVNKLNNFLLKVL